MVEYLVCRFGKLKVEDRHSAGYIICPKSGEEISIASCCSICSYFIEVERSE